MLPPPGSATWISPEPTFSRVLFEWPNHDLHFTTTREKVGSGLIHVALPGGGSIDFERIGGEPARRWSNLHLRRLQPR